MPTVELTLNGEKRQLETEDGESLLDALRERAGICSTKDGCQPQGQCGCCLALIDGQPKVTCAMTAERAAGKDIVTLEGVAEEERAQMAKAFLSAAGLQCGFCIPGIALRAKSLLDKNPDPSREEIAKAIDGHLCRCTGYVKIVDAIQLMAKARRGEPIPEPSEEAKVGKAYKRYRGDEMTLGMRPYVADMTREGMLHGAVLLSKHARAKIVRIDVEKAKAHPGVVAVATAKDAPGDRYNGLLYNDWPAFIAEGEEARCVGDVLAAVAAVDARTARLALELIEVELEVLPAVTTPQASLEAGAPQVNPTHANLLSRSLIQRGDADAALKASAHVVSGTFKTQRIEHLYLEPEAALAEPLPDGKIGVFTQGQGVFDDRRQIARLLNVSEDEIYVELVPNGGAFGGKEDMSIQSQTALLAKMTGKPVRLVANRGFHVEHYELATEP